MGDNLHEKNRKELKELCSRNNIRTAGVKHEDLVRLLRNKLYPSIPQTPRLVKARGPKVQSPEKDDGDSYKTPIKAADKGRTPRSSTLPREDVAASQRKNSGLSRRPLLSKSNTMTPRRTDFRTKTPGVDHDAKENFVRRLCQINGMSSLSRNSAEAPGQLEVAYKASPLSLIGEYKDGRIKAQADSNGKKTEDMTSPRASEGDADGTAVEPSDAGSDASRRISEIATDAGPDTLSDFSDADEFRSVSSEPISKFISISSRNSLRTQSSKMSLLFAQSGLSFFTAGSWGSDNSRSMDDLLATVDGNISARRDITEVIFPEFPKDSNFLVGDTDALDLSFLHAGAADPEVIVNGNDYEGKVDKFDVMDSPMARDYVTYNRGSETDIPEYCNDSNEVSIAELTSDQGEILRDVNMGNSVATETSIDPADKQRDSTAIIPAEDAESKEEGRINDEFLPTNVLAPGNEGTESEQSCSGIMHLEHAEPIAEDIEVGPEIHSEIPCLESNLPTFDTKDYNVAKKLVFEPEEIIQSAPLQQFEYAAGGKEDDGNNFQNSEEGPVLSVPKTIEAKDLALHSKISSPEEPTMNNQLGGLAETVSVTPPPTIENTSSDVDHGECNFGHGTVEQDKTSNIDQEGGSTSVEGLDAPAIHCKYTDAVTPSAGHRQESELAADTRVSPKVIDSFEIEDQDTSTLERIGRHLSQPQMDMSSVAPKTVIPSDSSLINNSSGNATPELGRSSCPTNEQECSDVKARDEQYASTSATVLDYNKGEREKENMQVKLSFPLSILLWCSQSCSPLSRNPSPSLES